MVISNIYTINDIKLDLDRAESDKESIHRSIEKSRKFWTRLGNEKSIELSVIELELVSDALECLSILCTFIEAS